MNIEDVLTDLFADEADHRPESDPVLDAVHERINRQRRSTLTRAASALGAAAAVAAIAVTAIVVTSAPSHHADPAGGAPPSPLTSAPATPVSSTSARPSPSSPASSSTPTAPVSSTSTPRPSSTAPAGGRGYSTINAGWLPGPAKPDPIGTSKQPGFEERDWDVTVDGVAMDVIIWTESGSLPSRMQATGGKSDYRHVTVNGHPGREFISDNITIIAFDLGNGTIAYVGPSVRHTTATVTRKRITAIARKVADNMEFNQHDPMG